MQLFELFHLPPLLWKVMQKKDDEHEKLGKNDE